MELDPAMMQQMAQGGGMTQEQAAEMEKQKQAGEAQRQEMLIAILSEEARARLKRVSLVKAEKARQVEDAILTMAKRGQIAEKVSEERVIAMLQGSSESEKKVSNVVFRRRNLDDDDEW